MMSWHMAVPHPQPTAALPVVLPILLALGTFSTPVKAQFWISTGIEMPVSAPDNALSQRYLASNIPVTGKARKFLVPVSGHVGQASIRLLSEADQHALYVFIHSETEHVGNLRYTLPVRVAEGEGVSSVILGPRHEATIDLPPGAEIELTIRAKKLMYQGVEVRALQSELKVRHTQSDGTVVTQKMTIVPDRLLELNGHKRKDTVVELERRERTTGGEQSRSTVQFELRELRSEDFEGRPGGPPAFVR
jgi:hypothetical protein